MESVSVISQEKAKVFADHLNADAFKHGETFDKYEPVEYGGGWAVAYYYEGRLVGFI